MQDHPAKPQSHTSLRTKSQVMTELHRDHIHIAKLMDILEREFQKIENIHNPDYVLMLDVMHYMTHYPDMFHHPKEDLVFGKMLERDVSQRKAIEKLEQEHQLLYKKGLELREMLETASSELAMVPRDIVIERGKEYVQLLRSHMSLEEGQVFPLAGDLITDEDSDEIEKRLQSPGDPLFGEAVADAYEMLYKYINDEATGA